MDKKQAELELGQLLARLSAAWNAHDAPAFVSCFAPDACFVTRDGRAMQGRAAIERRFLDMHHGASERVPQLLPEEIQVMFPTPGLAVVVLTMKTLRVSGQEKWASSLVAERSPAGEWLIVHHHGVTLPRNAGRLPDKARDWLRRWAI